MRMASSLAFVSMLSFGYSAHIYLRSAQQVTDRLDALIQKIYEIQGPYMHGEKPADVILVSYIMAHITLRLHNVNL